MITMECELLVIIFVSVRDHTEHLLNELQTFYPTGMACWRGGGWWVGGFNVVGPKYHWSDVPLVRNAISLICTRSCCLCRRNAY